MSRAHMLANLGGVIVPFLAFLVAVVLLWNTVVGWTDIAILTVGYLLTGIGITVGFHRLLTHRSFKTYGGIRYALAALGSMAVEGPVLAWVSDHRKHHQFSDREGDPTLTASRRGGAAGRSPERGSSMRTSVGSSSRRAGPTLTATPPISWPTAACALSTAPFPGWWSSR